MRTVFLLLLTCLLSAAATAQTGRRYILRDTFLRMTTEKCYDFTREEGERAFRARDWESAANLFRAAKNCADADQRKRSLMSQRIGDSRQAAIDELVEKEREATRTARQALATNRANDAMILLKDGYRSWAFRLADFADQYIAPPDGEPNVQTRQALLDAWNYIPYYHSWMREYPNMRVPFCFQIAENLPNTTQIQYLNWVPGGKLYAFSPQEHLLRGWTDNLTEAIEPIRLDTAFIGFEAAPDGRTLLFYSPKRLMLWRSPLQAYPIDISSKHIHWAFDAESSTFYYLDGQQIQGVSLNKIFAARSSRYAQRSMRNSNSGGDIFNGDGSYVWSNIDPIGLLNFGVKGNRLYLAYADQIRVAHAGTDTTTVLHMPYTLPDDTRADQVHLWLNEHLYTYTNDTLYVRFRLPDADTGTIVQEMAFRELTIAHNPRLLVTRELAQDANHSRAFFREISDEIAHFVRHDLEEPDKSLWYHADVSTDGSHLAVLTADGSLRVFELDQAVSGSTLPYFQTQGQPLQFCPDGTHFVVRGSRSLEVFSTGNPDSPASTQPLTDPEGGVLALGNQSVVVRLHADSTVLWHFSSGKSLRLPVDGTAQSFCLSSDERLLAYTDQNLVKVMDVEHGTVRATYPEGNLEVFDLAFVPNTTRLMLVTRNYDSDVSYGVDIKFWEIDRPEEEPELLFISDLQQVMPLIAFSPDSRWVALMDGKSTRVFDLNNLSEEHTSLQGQKWDDAACSTMTFSPDSRLLVMGYTDGHTIAWDIATRRPAYRLAPSVTKTASVVQLLFPDGGATLRQVLTPAKKTVDQTTRFVNTYTDRLLDVSTMREYLSQGERHLAALSPQQILKYDLESALSYPGNFERLARSGDLPLIRSFFDFYQQQALQSNNSTQVREYCERAFQLYQQLDANNREALRAPMLAMYDDLIWKLIQRKKPDEAAQMVQQVGRHFDHPLSLTRWNGHIALLRGDAYLRSAATYYANWIMRSAEAERIVDKYDYKKGEYTVFMRFYEHLSQEINRLNTYRLLHAPQQKMLCALLGDYTTLGFCTSLSEEPADVLQLEPATQQQWRIFQLLNNSESDRDLRFALEDARRLARQNAAYRPLLERAVLLQARRMRREAEFEQGSDRALQIYAQAARTVQEPAPFKIYKTEYWELLSEVQMATADIQFARSQLVKSSQTYREASASLGNFTRAAEQENVANDWVETLRQQYANLYTQLGFIALYSDYPNEADTLFAAASQIIPDEAFGIYTGHTALLRGDRIDALLNYGNIQTAEQLGQVWAQMDRMSEYLPAKRDAIQAFSHDIRSNIFKAMPELDSIEAQYWYATEQVAHFQATRQWPLAQAWSREMLRTVQVLLEKDHTEWEQPWFEAHLSASYYHLFGGNTDTQTLTQTIHYTEQAEQRLAAGGYYKDAYLLNTNLAHAYLLRNGPGDRDKALAAYRAFLEESAYTADRWNLLEKDFRDLEVGGVKWPPDMAQVIAQIKPKDTGQ